MKAYFLLQYKMANRTLADLDIKPVVGYILGALAFVLLSEYLFYKTDFAKYAMLLASFGLLIQASESRRTDFLKTVFVVKTYRLVRVLENLILCLPFSIVLICHAAFLASALLLVVAAILASFSFKNQFNYTIPTPFFRTPFEFIVGFRNTFYLFPLAYILTGIAINVDNLNLGIFAILLVFVVAMTYYLKPEHEYYVWTHAMSPARFLVRKLLVASINSVLLALPIAIALIAYYPSEISFIFMFVAIGLFFLLTIVLAKYAAYPTSINLPEGVVLAICIYFPPLLICMAPYFYSKAIKKLNPILK
jgi:hypothetical protein